MFVGLWCLKYMAHRRNSAAHISGFSGFTICVFRRGCENFSIRRTWTLKIFVTKVDPPLLSPASHHLGVSGRVCSRIYLSMPHILDTIVIGLQNTAGTSFIATYTMAILNVKRSKSAQQKNSCSPAKYHIMYTHVKTEGCATEFIPPCYLFWTR